MELSKSDIKILKGMAILFMLLLHLFCRKDVNGLYNTFPTIDGIPLIYYLALFGDACVPIYCFASGYGLFVSYKGTEDKTTRNSKRILKLLINYWIVLILFVTIAIFAGIEGYPGSLLKFLLNFFVLSSSYNGAWWFLQTYIILVFLAPLLVNLTIRYNSIIILFISGIIYLVSYVQRFRPIVDFGGNTVLNMLVNTIVLVGTSQLSFLVGTIFAKERVYSKLYKKFHGIAHKNALCLLAIFIMVIAHSVYESLIVAPLTAILFICFFSLMDKNILITKVLQYFGNHSTNIWLTHMFFYLIIFPEVTFAPRYPAIIFSWLLMLCLISSHVINYIYRPLVMIVDKMYQFSFSRRSIRV